MKLKKIISLLLVAVLLTLAACSSPAADGAKPAQENTGDQAAEADSESGVKDIALTDEVNQYGWTKPVNTIKFDYYSCDDDATVQSEEDERLAYVDQVLKDEFNVEINKLVFADDSNERLNLMLASNDYPDVIVGCSTAMANAFIDQGRAIDLTPYLEKYGQDILAGYGDYINLLRSDDGGLYRLCSDYGFTTDSMGKDFSIRWDWLLESGEECPNSFESYHDTIKKIVEQHPTNENGEKVYAFSAFTLQGAEFYQTPLLFLGFYNTSTGVYKLNDDGSITHWVDTDEGRQVAHYINKFWQEGLIDPDYQTKDYDTSKAFMANERVAGNIGTWWHNIVGGYQMWVSTEENYDVNKRMQNLTWQETDATPELISDSFIRAYNIVVTDHCENPEEVVMWMNWQQNPKGLAFTAMGPQGDGLAWKFDENGLIQIDERYWYGDPDNSGFLWDDFESECGNWNYLIGAPCYTPMSRIDNKAEGWADPVAAVNAWDLISDPEKLDPDRLTEYRKAQNETAWTSTTFLADTTLWQTSFASDSEEATILIDVNERLLTDWNLCIQASTDEECDALYDQMVEDMHNLGLEKLVAAQQKAFSINESKLNGTYWDK